MFTKITAMHSLAHLRIAEFGYEDIREKAKWDRGRRNYYIIHYVLEGEGYYNGRHVQKDEGFLIRPMKEARITGIWTGAKNTVWPRPEIFLSRLCKRSEEGQ